MDKSTTIIFDTETTGIRHAQILQLSIIDANGNVLFDELMKPRNVKQWADAEKIHHITYKMVEHKRTFKHWQKDIQKIFDSATCIIGYGVNFDLGMISDYINVDYEHQTIIDVKEIFAEIYNDIHPYFGTPRWQKLTTACKYFNYEWNEHGKPHGALADSYATLFVYNKCVELLEQERQEQSQQPVDTGAQDNETK